MAARYDSEFLPDQVVTRDELRAKGLEHIIDFAGFKLFRRPGSKTNYLFDPTGKTEYKLHIVYFYDGSNIHLL